MNIKITYLRLWYKRFAFNHIAQRLKYKKLVTAICTELIEFFEFSSVADISKYDEQIEQYIDRFIIHTVGHNFLSATQYEVIENMIMDNLWGQFT